MAKRIPRVTLKSRHRTIGKKQKQGKSYVLERSRRKALSKKKFVLGVQKSRQKKRAIINSKENRKLYKKGKVFMLNTLNQVWARIT